MKCNKLLRGLFCLTLVLLLLPAGATAAGYPDLEESHWAYAEMSEAISMGIIKGYEDGRIAPNDTLTWGQYLTMLERAFHPEAYDAENAVVTAEELPWYLSGYRSARETGLLPEEDFLVVEEALLVSPILRRDAVALLERVLPENAFGAREGSTAREAFSDWADLTSGHQAALARLYGLSIVNGRDDGTFGGGETIKRCDGSVLLLRTMNAARQASEQIPKPEETPVLPPESGLITEPKPTVEPEPTTEPKPTTEPEPEMDPEEAFWEAVSRGEASWEDYWMQDFLLYYPGEYDRKHVLLFGSADKRRFDSKEEAEANVTTVSFPVWKLDGSGSKVSSTASLRIHAAVADEVVAIFTEIYNDPEQFPIKNVGGYDWRGNSATGEHNCGTAIDINWDENYQIRYGAVQAGSLWQPGENPYSITPEGSVVRIFAEHGWSWGGDAWSWDWDPSEGYHDYMHFSYMGG